MPHTTGAAGTPEAPATIKPARLSASSITGNAAARLQPTGTQQTAGRNHQAAARLGDLRQGGSISSRRGGNHQAGAVVICLFLTTTIVATRQGGRWLVDATGIKQQGRQHIKPRRSPARREHLRHRQPIKPRRSPRQGGSTSPARRSGNQYNRQRRGDLPGRQQERRRGGNHHRRSSNTRAGGY